MDKYFTKEISLSKLISPQQQLMTANTQISAGKMLLANKIRDYLSVILLF